VARTFVAVWPPPAALDALLALPRPEHPDVRWLPRQSLHVTLRFLGEVEPTAVTDRLRAAGLARARAAIGPMTTVLGARVVVAPVDGLAGLAAAVTRATRDLGRPPADRPFVGHVTLARVQGAATAARVAGAPVDHDVDVEEVAVVTSRLAAAGPRYRTVATVPLG
jgi:2'-5' RNA ligase